MREGGTEGVRSSEGGRNGTVKKMSEDREGDKHVEECVGNLARLKQNTVSI